MGVEVSPSKRICRLDTLNALVALAGGLLLAGPSTAQVPAAAVAAPAPTPPPHHVPRIAERDAGELRADERRLRPREARGDDPDARRREAAHGHPRAEGGPGREGGADPPHADALRRRQARKDHRKLSPRPDARRLRQPRRDDRRGRLHPRRAGRARQARLRGRLRDEPPRARAAEPDAGGPRDGHLGHDRLAREERPGIERQGRHPRHLVRRIPAADGARESAPGAQGVRADEPDGRRLDGRRLVPQRRLPPARDVVLLRSGGDAQVGEEMVDEPLRRLRHVHGSGVGGGARAPQGAGAGRHVEKGPRASELRRLLARSGGRQDPRGAAAESTRDAGSQPVGPGRHLRRARRLQGDQAEGQGAGQGVPRDGALASRPGDQGRKRARRDQIQQRYLTHVPA